MSKERLRKYIENDITYQDYKMKKPIPQYLKLHTTLCEDIENVLKENQQLKEIIDELNENNVYWVNRCANAETMLHERDNVLGEIREYIETKLRDVNLTYGIDNEFRKEYDEILEILDKVKEW